MYTLHNANCVSANQTRCVHTSRHKLCTHFTKETVNRGDTRRVGTRLNTCNATAHTPPKGRPSGDHVVHKWEGKVCMRSEALHHQKRRWALFGIGNTTRVSVQQVGVALRGWVGGWVVLKRTCDEECKGACNALATGEAMAIATSRIVISLLTLVMDGAAPQRFNYVNAASSRVRGRYPKW